ncbi:uncharacterized protein LOC111077807 isoform X2 [Drosophila obscura]|uniref:uncharacterized protein LOC111077807 isoform X2 n=1 Tax=Drosophila obscura TaxID=7282 RepID=UPI001BB1C996|nr:uncharacterized protein LOC111077807 isoform X2 [Drosophila obscura]
MGRELKRRVNVFCVPIFPYNSNSQHPIHPPKFKSDLVGYVEAYLNDSETLPALEYNRLKGLESWLHSTFMADEMGVYQVEKSPENCAVYVSANLYEPFYDQRVLESPYTTDSTRLQVLSGLEFDFVLMDGAFLLHRLNFNKSSRVRSNHEYMSPDQVHIREMIMLSDLTLWPNFV